MMELLQSYTDCRQKIFDYFGYIEDWRVLPFNDAVDYYWHLTEGEDSGGVRFADSKESLEDEEAGEYYENEIYTQRHLPKWVYRGEDYTMICIDTHTDGNQFLQIFKNDKEI